MQLSEIKIFKFSSLFLFLVLFVFILTPSKDLNAQAPSVTELYGSAWSDNIGWISFNSCEVTQAGALDCGLIDYGVEVGDITGNVTGEAWSDNIGWIKFGGLSSFPSGSGTVGENAEINLSSGAVTGWIRACAGTSSGDCSSMTSQSDGWDGWISLSGNLHSTPSFGGTGGVTFDSLNDRIIGKAWGGSVVGWIDFVDVRYGPIPPDPEPIEYNLSNSTEVSILEIPRGSIATASVIREWVDGDPEDVTLSSSASIDGGEIDIEIVTNNPCEIGEDNQTCSSNVSIDVSVDATLGLQSFIVQGESETGSEEQTTIQFTVTEEEPSPSDFSCFGEGNPWLYQTIKWTAVVDEPTGEEDYSWDQDDEDLSYCEDSSICEISYTSVGEKIVELSINGPSGTFTQCDAKNIGARVFFKEI